MRAWQCQQIKKAFTHITAAASAAGKTPDTAAHDTEEPPLFPSIRVFPRIVASTRQTTLLFDQFQTLITLCKREREGVHRVCGRYTIVIHCSMTHNVVMCVITSHVNQLAWCDHITICASSCLFLFSHTKHGAVCCVVWSHHAFCIHSLCGMVNHHHSMIGSW